jgi:hypothetical protein
LLVSQLLTLYITPVVYLYLDKVDRLIKYRLDPRADRDPKPQMPHAVAAESWAISLRHARWRRGRWGDRPDSLLTGKITGNVCKFRPNTDSGRLIHGLCRIPLGNRSS